MWTKEGMRFSWRVMLVEKTGLVDFQVRDPATGHTWEVVPTDYLTSRQAKMMATRPDMILSLAHAIADRFTHTGAEVEVRADAYVALNGRRSQRFIDPTVDLAAEKVGFAAKSWLLPFQNTPPLVLRMAVPPVPVAISP